MPQLRVTLKKSMIGQQWRIRRTVVGLGLHKVNSSNILPDNDSVRGMIRKARHLVDFEPVEETAETAATENTA